MSKSEPLIPPPGSMAAVAAGCRCAVIDNHYGRGFRVAPNGQPMFFINQECLLHGNASSSK